MFYCYVYAYNISLTVCVFFAPHFPFLFVFLVVLSCASHKVHHRTRCRSCPNLARHLCRAQSWRLAKKCCLHEGGRNRLGKIQPRITDDRLEKIKRDRLSLLLPRIPDYDKASCSPINCSTPPPVQQQHHQEHASSDT